MCFFLYFYLSSSLSICLFLSLNLSSSLYLSASLFLSVPLFSLPKAYSIVSDFHVCIPNNRPAALNFAPHLFFRFGKLIHIPLAFFSLPYFLRSSFSLFFIRYFFFSPFFLQHFSVLFLSFPFFSQKKYPNNSVFSSHCFTFLSSLNPECYFFVFLRKWNHISDISFSLSSPSHWSLVYFFFSFFLRLFLEFKLLIGLRDIFYFFTPSQNLAEYRAVNNTTDVLEM